MDWAHDRHADSRRLPQARCARRLRRPDRAALVQGRGRDIRRFQGWTGLMTDTLIPEGFRKLGVPDDFVGLIGPLWYKVEGETLRVGLPLEQRHGHPTGWAHGGLLV